jgi:hypothetical protein
MSDILESLRRPGKMVCPNCLVYCRKERQYGDGCYEAVCAYCGEPSLTILTEEEIAKLRKARSGAPGAA